MSYDPNSFEARKGKIGEEIVKRFLESCLFEVTKPMDVFESGASIVDFVVRDEVNEFFAEVKVQAAYPYGVEQAPCYSFPASHIEAYIDYGKRNNLPVEFYVVDPDSGFVYCESLSKLEAERIIDGRTFPFNRHSDALGGEVRYYNRAQFECLWQLGDDDIAALKNPVEQVEESDDVIDTEETSAQVQVAEVMTQVGTIQTPNADVEVFRGGDGATFLKFNSLYRALGYNGSVSLEKSPVGKVAVENNYLTRIRPVGKQTIDAIQFVLAIHEFLPRLMELKRVALNVPPLLEILRREFDEKYRAIEQSEHVTPEKSSEAKTLLERFAEVVGVDKAELIANVLNLRQNNFDRQQQRLQQLFA